MRLEITRRTDLATRALLELARLDRRVKAAELAELIGTTPGFLSQALSPLAAKGWVRSEPGPTGGYVLVADPDALSVLDVIEAVEGPTDTGACVLEDRPCGSGRLCALHGAWAGARSVLIERLDGMSLASIPAGRRP
jgi:Rrf2 family protein